MMRVDHTRHLVALATVTVLYVAAIVPAQAQRSGVGPCREGVLSLIAKLDAGEQSAPDYRKVARDVVETCGSTRGRASGPAEINRASCRRLALDVLNTIEDGKMNTRLFTQIKGKFARSCAPA